MEKLLKITRNKRKKHKKIVMLAKSKLNSIQALILKASKDSEISDKDYTVIINEEENYRRLKEKISMIKSQRSDTRKKTD